MRTLLALLLAAAPPAHADDALRARVLEMLSAYETAPGAAEWRALGAGAGAELLAVADDAALSHTRRANAVLALGWFPTDDARAYLARLATADAADPMFRRKACYALVNGWGDAALPELGVALAAPDPQLRAAAARAVGRLGTPAAAEALRARLGVETDPMVRALLTPSAGGRE